MQLHCKTEAHKLRLKNPMTKKYGRIYRTDQNTPETKYRKDLISSKVKNSEHFMNFSVQAAMTTTKQGTFQQKTQKNPLVIKSFLKSNYKRLRNGAIPKNFNQKHNPIMEKTHSI